MEIKSLFKKLFTVFILIVNFFCTSVSNKEETIKETTTKTPSDQFFPFSRMIIDNGLHGGEIRKTSTDINNKYLVTGSDDRTVKVWDLSNGKLSNIIRPPVGKKNEGQIYAVSISPDASTIACGGQTGEEWDHAFSLYFFERVSGKLIHTITGLPEVIYHVTYSPSGNFLAVTLGGTHGIRVYRLPEYKLIAMDSKYEDDSYGADFDNSDRLVTTSFDGHIRLYDSNFKLIAKEKMKTGSKPYNIHFSKSRTKIAVGYADTNNVDVLSGQSILGYRSHLDLLYTANNKDTNGNLQSVCFSNDEEYLYAGGTWTMDGMGFVRKWEDQGKGKYSDIKLNSRNVSFLLPYKNRGAIVVTGHPSIQIINNNFEIEFQNLSPIIDYGTSKGELSIFKEGTSIHFDYGGQSKGLTYFSLRQKKLIFEPPENLEMMPPVKISSTLDIKNWQNSPNPSMNNKPLQLMKGDISRSIAIASDGKSFILGTNRFLYHISSSGKVDWSIEVPGIAWALNISGNNKFAIAALSDGTIRWYRIKDGEELVAFLPHTDQKRWIMFTPLGYYDASKGGDELIGWTLNHDKRKESIYFPLFALDRLLYKPEIIQKIINSIKTDKEVISMLGIKPINITGLLSDMIENIKLGEKSFKNIESDKGEPFGKVFSVDPTEKDILITYSGNNSFINQTDKIFVLDENTKIYLETKYINHTMLKCRVLEADKKLLQKIKLNSIVYKE